MTSQSVESVAQTKFNQFLKDREKYFENRAYFNKGVRPRVVEYVPGFAANQLAFIINLFRLLTDIKTVALRYSHTVDQRLKKARIKITVIARSEVLEKNNLFFRLAKRKRNRKIINYLFDWEVFHEVNCEHFLMIQGVNKYQLYHLVRKLGQNPTTFLSDHRGENAGRIAVDNYFGGLHPFLDNPPQSELKYWQKLFPGAPKWFFSSNWSVSRTHSPVFEVKTKLGKKIYFLPIHVDKFNSISFVKELIYGKDKDEEKSALHYHLTATGPKELKIGTGLYDLGCAVFIWLCRNAKSKGVIHHLEVIGEEKLNTSHTILEDDKVTWEIEKLMHKSKI